MIEIASQRKDGIWFTVAQNEKGQLVGCAFSDKSKAKAEKSVLKSIPRSQVRKTGTVNQRIFQEISALYAGKGKTSLRSFDLSNVSEFRRRVYSLLLKVPSGKVVTYGGLAKRVKAKRYARAVGTAMATNPLPLIIPCHRVVPASLKVGNYGMPGRKPSEGGYVKHGLLEREGVVFNGEKVSQQSIWKTK